MISDEDYEDMLENLDYYKRLSEAANNLIELKTDIPYIDMENWLKEYDKAFNHYQQLKNNKP